MANLDNLSEIKKLDVSNMMGNVINFPSMVKAAIKICKEVKIGEGYKDLTKILITGLGGSAMGGDIIKNVLGSSLPVPVVVNRNYSIPKWVDNKTLVFAVSHSGNTEETISAFKSAVVMNAKIIVVTSGGTLEKLALEHKVPVLHIPAGAPPRASLPYLFFPIIVALDKLRYIKLKESELAELVSMLETLKKIYSPESKMKENPAKQLASKLFAKPVIVFGSADTTEAIATRWKCQFAENAKVFGFTSTIPEMNHNEIVGWNLLKKVLRKFAVVFLKDKFDHPQIKKRIALTNEVASKKANWVGEVSSVGEGDLARAFSLIYLGDFVSVYLAILYGEDPTAIKMIDTFKKELAKK